MTEKADTCACGNLPGASGSTMASFFSKAKAKAQRKLAQVNGKRKARIAQAKKKAGIVSVSDDPVLKPLQDNLLELEVLLKQVRVGRPSRRRHPPNAQPLSRANVILPDRGAPSKAPIPTSSAPNSVPSILRNRACRCVASCETAWRDSARASRPCAPARGKSRRSSSVFAAKTQVHFPATHQPPLPSARHPLGCPPRGSVGPVYHPRVWVRW